MNAEGIESRSSAPAPTTAAKPVQDDPLADVLIYCDPRCHDLLRASVGQGCAVPEIGFELQDDAGRVCAEAEMAWPDKNVAVVLPERAEAAKTFRERGWTVVEPTASADEIPT